MANTITQQKYISHNNKSALIEHPLEIKLNQFSKINLYILKYLQIFFHQTLKLSSKSKLLIIFMQHNTSNHLTLENDIVNHLFYTSNHDIIHINNKNNLNTNFITKQRAADFLIFIENIYDIKFLKNIHNTLKHSNHFIPISIIFTKTTSEFIMEDKINIIFQRLLQLKFYNINANIMRY